MDSKHVIWTATVRHRIRYRLVVAFYRSMQCIRGTSHGPVSVCHKSMFYRNGGTNRAGFWHVSFLPAVLHCVQRKFRYLQNKGTSLWNFVLNPGLRKFRHGISIVETCYQHRRRSRGRHRPPNDGVGGTMHSAPPQLWHQWTVTKHTVFTNWC